MHWVGDACKSSGCILYIRNNFPQLSEFWGSVDNMKLGIRHVHRINSLRDFRSKTLFFWKFGTKTYKKAVMWIRIIWVRGSRGIKIKGKVQQTQILRFFSQEIIFLRAIFSDESLSLRFRFRKSKVFFIY